MIKAHKAKSLTNKILKDETMKKTIAQKDLKKQG
jgi:hypothetical protein